MFRSLGATLATAAGLLGTARPKSCALASARRSVRSAPPARTTAGEAGWSTRQVPCASVQHSASSAATVATAGTARWASTRPAAEERRCTTEKEDAVMASRPYTLDEAVPVSDINHSSYTRRRVFRRLVIQEGGRRGRGAPGVIIPQGRSKRGKP